jgi:mediator of RNA polymerase II transcription subunit 4
MSEPESMRSILERPISQLQTLSQALFSALSTGHVTEPPIAALAACDAELAEAMRLTRIHLLKQKRIEQLMDEVYELDAQLIEVVETLARGQRELQAVIEEGEERISSADKAKNSEVSYGTRRLCLTYLPRSCGFLPATNCVRVKASRFLLRSSECSDG